MKKAIIVNKTKIVETTFRGVDPFQPIEEIEITKGLVGYRLRFIWPKPIIIKKKWWEFWK